MPITRAPTAFTHDDTTCDVFATALHEPRLALTRPGVWFEPFSRLC